jgi:ribosome modulation factor
MIMTEIKDKARELGIEPKKMKKPELIHAVQTAEGYRACYGTSKGQCPYTTCCFMKDCLKVRL